MQAVEPLVLRAASPRFGAEAVGECCQLDRELCLLQDGAGEGGGERDFSRPDEAKLLALLVLFLLPPLLLLLLLLALPDTASTLATATSTAIVTSTAAATATATAATTATAAAAAASNGVDLRRLATRLKPAPKHRLLARNVRSEHRSEAAGGERGQRPLREGELEQRGVVL